MSPAQQTTHGTEALFSTARDTLQPVLLSEKVYLLIRQAIIAGDLEPGARIVESEYARQMGVSQAPVREACRRLAHEGLVTYVPRRGNFVTEVSLADVQKARSVRGVLERFAASELAGHVEAELAKRLGRVVEHMRDAARARDLGRWRDLDMTFHSSVVDATGNEYLIRLWQTLEPSLRALRVVADPLFDGDRLALSDEHGLLLDLLKTGAPDVAGHAFWLHASGNGPVPDPRTPAGRT